MTRKAVSSAASVSRRQKVKKNGKRGEQIQELRRSALATAVASCLLVGAPEALGQSANSNLRGLVTSDAGAAQNTEVVATNAATGVLSRTQTDANGRYVIIGLPPGTYVVRAGEISNTVTLSIASNAVLNLEPGTSAEIEEVTVYGQQTAALDVHTSEVGGTISPREIAELPQATRNFLEFADTVPGMAFTTDSQGITSLRGGATSNDRSNLYIDGVGQKGYVQAGGIAGQNQTRGNPFPQLAIGEYKVITSNYKAEYGQVAGALVTAATRSGTNEFQADVYYRYTDEGLRSERPDEIGAGEKVDSKTEEYGFAVAGPIIQDRLHYIVAYEYKDLITPQSVLPDSNATGFVQYLPADALSQFGPRDVPFEEDLIFGKLSWNVTDDDLIDVSISYRDEVQVDSVGGTRSAEHGRDVINKDTRVNLRWERRSHSWFNEALITTEETENNPFPTGIGNGIIYAVLNRDPVTGVFLGQQWNLIEVGPSSGFDAQQRLQKGWSISDNLTFVGLDWFGDHTIKMGVSYKDVELTSQDAAPINPQFSFEVDSNGPASQPFRVAFNAPFSVEGQRATVDSDNKQYGFYIQDDWAIGDKLILNLGLRYDYETNPAYTDFVTSQDFVQALYQDDPDNPGQPWADRLLPGGMDAADFISTGNNRNDFDDAWQPRVGFSYDFNADEQYVLHGGAGRFYDRNLFGVLGLEVSKAALSPINLLFQDPATGECYNGDTSPACIPWDQNYFDQGIPALSQAPISVGSRELFMLNNNLKTPYTDQYSLGLSTQIADWQTDATVQRIDQYDGFIFTLINRWPDGSFFQNGSQPWGHPVPGYANTILGNNGIESENTQILLSARKPYTVDSGWAVSLAYTHTDAKHNRQLDDNFAFDNARIQDYPFIKANGVPEHRFVAAGSIDGPWGLTFGAKIVLETPRPINQIRDYGNRPPDGSFNQPVAIDPPGTGSFLIGGDIWGYRTVDLQATKEFRIGDYGLTARVNLLNAFDFKNYSSYNVPSVGSGGVFDPVVEVNRFGNAYYVPQTITFEIGANF